MSMNDSLLFVMKEVLSTVSRLSCLLPLDSLLNRKKKR